VLFASSDEAPGCAGLGVFEGDVARLPTIDPSTNEALKIPHIGWNVARPANAAHAFLPTNEEYFYFVHSFAVRPADPSIIAATTDYGASFVSAVAKENVFACQFHPEKSQGAGLALLTRFVTA